MSDSKCSSGGLFVGDDRGVSETLGYVLLIAVVFTSVGAVALMGAPVIDDQQEAEYMSNTVRAFEVFGNNLEAVERDRAPSRETEMRFQGGTLFQSEDHFMQVTVERPDGSSDTHQFGSTPVTYEKDGVSVSYESGAVIRDDHGESIMRTEPPFEFRDDRIRMSVIMTSVVDEEQSVAGAGKMSIVADGVGSEVTAIEGQDSPDDVRVEVLVDSPRGDAWEQYFEDQGAESVTTDPDTGEVTAEFTAEEAMIRESLIEVDARN